MIRVNRFYSLQTLGRLRSHDTPATPPLPSVYFLVTADSSDWPVTLARVTPQSRAQDGGVTDHTITPEETRLAVTDGLPAARGTLKAVPASDHKMPCPRLRPRSWEPDLTVAWSIQRRSDIREACPALEVRSPTEGDLRPYAGTPGGR